MNLTAIRSVRMSHAMEQLQQCQKQVVETHMLTEADWMVLHVEAENGRLSSADVCRSEQRHRWETRHPEQHHQCNVRIATSSVDTAQPNHISDLVGKS